MNIQNTLTAIVQHYNKSRGSGHTRTMLEGVNHTPGPCIVIAANRHEQSVLQDQAPPSCVVQNLQNPNQWYAMPAFPLVLDNHAMVELCRDALREIDRLERRIEAIAKLAKP